MDTLDEISAAADVRTFPRWVLMDAERVGCFFAAGFLGRNDVIHVRNAGVKHATLVDQDEGKLAEMHRLYAMPDWRYVVGDCYAEARARAKDPFDVVIVDPWTNGVEGALHDLPLWCSLARRHVVIGVTREWFDGYGVEADADAFTRWEQGWHWNSGASPYPCAEILRRSSFRGGVYWAVLTNPRRGA